MVRQLKSFTQIQELLLCELQKNTGLHGVSPNLVALPERDSTGCNWSVGTWAGAGAAQAGARAQLAALVSDLQRRYNAIGRLP